MDEELAHDCAVAAAVMLVNAFDEGATKPELLAVATLIVSEAIKSYIAMKGGAVATEPSLN